MKKHSMAIVGCESGDWEAMFIDRKIYTQGHSLSNGDFVEAIREFKHFEDVQWYEVSDIHMDLMGGQFPDNLDEIDPR